jgi:hypothetical protein
LSGESKREKRIRRNEIKLKKETEKKARIVEVVSTLKQPQELILPSPCRIPSEQKKGSLGELYMRWSQDKEDKNGTWSWGVQRDWGEPLWNTLIYPFLSEYAKKKWKIIFAETWQNDKKCRKKHVYYDVNRIHEEAIKRLVQLELDDQTRIFRFRLSGKRRLYGFTFSDIFATVWYDPTHNIYPLN